jgi:hypothetical protein
MDGSGKKDYTLAQRRRGVIAVIVAAFCRVSFVLSSKASGTQSIVERDIRLTRMTHAHVGMRWIYSILESADQNFGEAECDSTP